MARKCVLMVRPLYHEAGQRELAHEVRLITADPTDEETLCEQIAGVEGVFVPAPTI